MPEANIRQTLTIALYQGTYELASLAMHGKARHGSMFFLPKHSYQFIWNISNVFFREESSYTLYSKFDIMVGFQAVSSYRAVQTYNYVHSIMFN